MSSGHFTTLVFARLRALKGEGGITLVEGLIAMTLFLVVATGLVGVLTAGIASHRLARENSSAQQVAMEQIETARRLPYDKVGIGSGNPPGDLEGTKTFAMNGFKATMTTQVSYIDDPTPTSYATLANYKRVTVTITRDRDSKVLARQVTNIAPVARAPYGGINNAIVNVLVTDYALNTPLPGETVWLKNGPSSDRSDVANAAGRVTFPALTPTSGSQYYDVTVPSSSGYETLPEDLAPSSAAAHFQLSPSQTKDTAVRLYKPAQINVTVKDALGNPYTGAIALDVGSGRHSQEFTYSTPTYPIAITALAAEKLVPGIDYWLAARTTTGLKYYTAKVSQGVPVGYPTNLVWDVVLQFPVTNVLTTSTVTVTVKDSSGSKLGNARVDITGGPSSTYLTGFTDASGTNKGKVVFTNVPAGLSYTVTAWDPTGAVDGVLVNQDFTSSASPTVTVS